MKREEAGYPDPGGLEKKEAKNLAIQMAKKRMEERKDPATMKRRDMIPIPKEGSTQIKAPPRMTMRGQAASAGSLCAGSRGGEGERHSGRLTLERAKGCNLKRPRYQPKDLKNGHRDRNANSARKGVRINRKIAGQTQQTKVSRQKDTKAARKAQIRDNKQTGGTLALRVHPPKKGSPIGFRWP
jgi:hypothetical protein